MSHDLGKRAKFPTTECLVGSCIVWRVSVGWKGETELAKERLPFCGKVWYNGMAEGKNAAGRSRLRLRLAGTLLRVLFDYCSANSDCNSFIF